MILVPLAVLWGGYTLVYYGYCMMRGEGMGIGDLVMPNRWGDADGRWKTLGQASASAAPAPQPYVPGPGVQPGSPYYPPNPKGGLPSVPPLGGTPPSGY